MKLIEFLDFFIRYCCKIHKTFECLHQFAHRKSRKPSCWIHRFTFWLYLFISRLLINNIINFKIFLKYILKGQEASSFGNSFNPQNEISTNQTDTETINIMEIIQVRYNRQKNSLCIWELISFSLNSEKNKPNWPRTSVKKNQFLRICQKQHSMSQSFPRQIRAHR